jgi:lactoylglutathione lyase/glyoxylase I family protein
MLFLWRPDRHAERMSILSLAHACIKSTNLEQTAAFYCDGLGMKKHFDFTRVGKVIGFYLKAANDTFIEVFLADEVDSTDKRCLNHFCLETGDLEALRNRLVQRGFAPGEIKMGSDQTLQFWAKDPNGLDVEFQQYSPKSAQVTGENVEVNW